MSAPIVTVAALSQGDPRERDRPRPSDRGVQRPEQVRVRVNADQLGGLGASTRRQKRSEAVVRLH
jgi:hypothetical protein